MTVSKASKRTSSGATRTSRGFSRSQRWEKLLAIAAEEFRRSGYQSTSMEDIAERMGIRKASLYHYISSKEDLLYELEVRAHEVTLEIINGSTPGTVGAVALQDFISSWIAASAQPGTEHLRVGAHDLQHLAAERRVEIEAMRDVVLQHVEELVARGQHDGSLATGIRPRAVASAVLSLLNSPTAQPRAYDQWPQVATACSTFLLHGLRPAAA